MKLLKRGDIVFVQGKGIISKIIRLFDRGTYSHCAVAISDSRVIEADVDTKVAIRPFNKDKYNEVEVIDLGLSLKQRKEVYETAMSMIGTRYDYFQLLWYVLRRIFKLKGKNRLNNPKYVICSELVFLVLDRIGALDDLGIKETIYDGADLTPNELYDLVKFVSKK